MRILRRVVIPLFLLAYCSSCFITNQFRAERTARRVVRATAARHIEISDETGAASEDNYPRYREAKKASFDFHFLSVASVDLPSLVGECEFASLELYWETHNSIRVVAVRAPPRQAASMPFEFV